MGSLLAATPILRLRTGPLAGKVYEVRNALRIGRHPYNEVSLADAAVSRYHCWITLGAAGCHLEDLASVNGTYVDGVRLLDRCELRPGAVVRVGGTELVFTEEEA
jgi:pSer/pThr/pTyr-binding forkhead associated (FHA) protein